MEDLLDYIDDEKAGRHKENSGLPTVRLSRRIHPRESVRNAVATLFPR